MRSRGSQARDDEPSIAGQVLVLQVLVVLALVAAAFGLAVTDARRDARTTATDQAIAVARAVAAAPTVRRAVQRPDPTAVLQPFAEQVRRQSGVDAVVVISMDRLRYTHPDPELIGQRVSGDVGGAPQGEIFTQEFTGPLGPSVRAVVPVIDGDRVVAMVVTAITVATIDRGLRRDVMLLGVVALVVLLAGLLGVNLINRRVRRQTHGLGAHEMKRMYEYHQAVLTSVREGLLLLDAEGRVQLANEEARRLLALPKDVVGRPVAELALPPGLVRAALGELAEPDEVYVVGERILLVSSAPAAWDGHGVGAVVTLRDHTELRALLGELHRVQRLSETLRSQNHEAANRLHTVVSLIEMGRPEEAVEFATHELDLAQRLTDQVVEATGDPVVTALLLGKSSEAAECGIELTLDGSLPSDRVPGGELVTVLGNLVDNAFDAVAGQPERQVSVRLGGDEEKVSVVVADSGSGLSEQDARQVLKRGWTTKASGPDSGGRGIGLALVGQVVRRRAGRIRIGRSRWGGAEFEVTLAADAATDPEGASPPSDDPSSPAGVG